MTNRLPFNCRLPQGYQQGDFADILADIVKMTEFKINDGRISMGLFHKSMTLDRFDRKFDVLIFGLAGHIYVTIHDITGLNATK